MMTHKVIFWQELTHNQMIAKQRFRNVNKIWNCAEILFPHEIKIKNLVSYKDRQSDWFCLNT